MNAVDIDERGGEAEFVGSWTAVPVIRDAFAAWRVREVVSIPRDGVEGLEGLLIEDAVRVGGAVVAHAVRDEHVGGLGDEACDEAGW